MRIAHVGPRLARRGGPAGYLWQLAAAAEQFANGSACTVTFPRRAAASPSRPESYAGRAKAVLRRAKRAVVGPPTFFRPTEEDLRRDGGAIDALLAASMQWVCLDAAESLDAAVPWADVLFAHEAAVAERLMTKRRNGQQVWLMMHSPLPVALDLAWSWGVPEWPWTELAKLSDVDRWTGWEVNICSQVDRLITACPEAAAELARADRRFSTLSFDYVLTGGAGPAREFAGDSTAELRRRWGLPTDIPVGLFVGSPLPYRGLDVLADAVSALPSSVRGIIAVAGPSKDKVPADRRLRALGPVREIGDLLRGVDFVVNVNRFSLFDLSTIEAAEAGCAMLLHATGGNRRFHQLGAGCLMVSDLNRASVAAGLTELFEMPAARRRALGEASRACYEQHLTLGHLWANHVALYGQAVTTHTAASGV